MALNGLKNPSLQFILFGGKGGVGKTTMAVATALELARDQKVLLFTTDPAPSLADSFGQAIGNEPTAVVGTRNLFAMEMDAGECRLSALYSRYRANRQEEKFRHDIFAKCRKNLARTVSQRLLCSQPRCRVLPTCKH